MVELNKPALPVLISDIEVKKIVNDWFKKRRHADPEIVKIKMRVKPFYYFKYYHFFIDVVNKAHKELQGISCFDPYDMILDDNLAKIVQEKRPKTIHHIEFDQVKIFEPELSIDEAKEIIKSKIAKDFKLSSKEVTVSGLKLFYVPIYVVKAKFKDKIFDFHANAFTTKLILEPDIKAREKTHDEILTEFKQEMKSPANWFKYLVGMIPSFKPPADKKSDKSNNAQNIVVILIIILLILLVAFKFKLI